MEEMTELEWLEIDLDNCITAIDSCVEKGHYGDKLERLQLRQ